MTAKKDRTLVSFDWAAKKILRDKANFDILEDFLATLLKQEIKIISILESEGTPEHATNKFNRVDLLVQNQYYLIEVERFQNVIKSDLDEWVYFFKNSEIKDDFKSKNIQRAREKLDLLKMSESERKAYERYLMDKASERDMLESSKIEGKIERTVEIAKTMLAEGMQISLVSKVTGLPETEIMQLKSGLNHA
jgi:hypothetical protein